MTVDLSTTLAGIPLATCLYNASGPRSGTAAALQRVAQSKGAGAVLSKSATLEAQTGNPQPRIWHSPDGLASFNSEGLPNQGIDYYIAASTIEEAMLSGTAEKPYVVSLSGRTLADNLEMLRRIAASSTRPLISAIELNLACPNVIGKPIIAYDFEQMDSILTQVSKAVKGLPPLGVKLPPYLDFSHFQQAAAVLNKHKGTVKYVVSINTIGNALAVDAVSEAPYISSNHGFAGLSGHAVKYTALANVCKLRECLDDDIDIVGVGGIQSGQDAFEMLLVGATAVQIGTCHWKEGPSCFDRIRTELEEVLLSKGYSSVQECKGKLREWSKEGAAKSRGAAKTHFPSALSMTSARSISTGSKVDDATFYKSVSAVLAVLLAILLTNNFFHINLLPSE